MLKKSLYYNFIFLKKHFFFNSPFKCFLALEGLIHSELFKKEITDNNINELLIKIDDVIFDLKISEEASIDYETLKCFILNFSIDLNNLECMKGITGVLKLPLLKNLLAAPYYSEIKKQPYRSRSLLEVYLKKKLLKKSQDYNETDLKEFEIWLSFFLEIFRYLQENQSLKEKYIVKYKILFSRLKNVIAFLINRNSRS